MNRFKSLVVQVSVLVLHHRLRGDSFFGHGFDSDV